MSSELIRDEPLVPTDLLPQAQTGDGSPTTADAMHIAVRCPNCLLTVYTARVTSDKKGMSVKSLSFDSLQYYNCPFQLCEFHAGHNHGVNLYTRVQPGSNIIPSAGFVLRQMTAETRPFRSGHEVAAISINLDAEPAEDAVLQEPSAVVEAQVGKDARGAQADVRGEDGKGGAATSSITVTGAAPHNKTTRTIVKWTTEEMRKLTILVNDGRSFEEIAKEMDRSASGVKNKIASMREKGELQPASAIATPRKRKRGNETRAPGP